MNLSPSRLSPILSCLLLVAACGGAEDPAPAPLPEGREVDEQRYVKSTKAQLRQNCDTQQLTQDEVRFCNDCVQSHPGLSCACQIECFPSGMTTRSCNCYSHPLTE